MLSFQVSSGGNDNYFLRDNITSAQMLLTSANNTKPCASFGIRLACRQLGGLVSFYPLANNATANAKLGISVVKWDLQKHYRRV